MMTNESKYSVPNRAVMEAEIDISAAGAITAVRPSTSTATTGQGVQCTKSSTATYTFVFKGNNHQMKLRDIVGRRVTLNGAPTGPTTAIITSVSQATDGSDDITVVAKLTNATFVETPTTGACNLGVDLTFQSARMTNPFD